MSFFKNEHVKTQKYYNKSKDRILLIYVEEEEKDSCFKISVDIFAVCSVMNEFEFVDNVQHEKLNLKYDK